MESLIQFGGILPPTRWHEYLDINAPGFSDAILLGFQEIIKLHSLTNGSKLSGVMVVRYSPG